VSEITTIKLAGHVHLIAFKWFQLPYDIPRSNEITTGCRVKTNRGDGVTICKEIKLKQGDDRQISVSLCTENPHTPTKFQWKDVICPECLRMREELKEKRRQQTRRWRKDNL